MTIQLRTSNCCKYSCVGLLPAQQRIQCKYTAQTSQPRCQFLLGDMLERLDSSLERGPVFLHTAAYFNKWRTPEAPPQIKGKRQRSRETMSPSKTTDTPPPGGGGGVGGSARHLLCVFVGLGSYPTLTYPLAPPQPPSTRPYLNPT